jgi:N-methylhydantoinase B/oxoprolinase/acetone carboxylase alpha subunit
VIEDVTNGYVSREQAERDYGVVLDPETLEVVRLEGRKEEG